MELMELLIFYIGTYSLRICTILQSEIRTQRKFHDMSCDSMRRKMLSSCTIPHCCFCTISYNLRQFCLWLKIGKLQANRNNVLFWYQFLFQFPLLSWVHCIIVDNFFTQVKDSVCVIPQYTEAVVCINVPYPSWLSRKKSRVLFSVFVSCFLCSSDQLRLF